MTITIHWAKGVAGTFDVSGNWTPPTTPSASTNAYIDATSTTTYLVTSNAAITVNGLLLDSSAELEISIGAFTINAFEDNVGGDIQVDSGATLNVGESGTPDFRFQNTGVLDIDGASSTNAVFKISSPTVLFQGGGKVTLAGSHSEIIAGAAPVTLINLDNTISGGGTIGSAHMTLQNANAGTIDANGSLALKLNTGATNTILNDGLIESTSTGGLVIDSSMYEDGRLFADGTGAVTIADNADVSGGGDIKAEVSGSKFVLDNGALSNGGILSTVAGSAIRTVAGTTDTLSGSDIENAGVISVANNSTLMMNATVVNSGALELLSTGNATKLEFYSTGITFDGAGRIVLSDNADNEIVSNGDDQTLVNNGNTISGAGTIGDAHLRIDNHPGGVIDANATVGMILTADTPTPTLDSDFNLGLIETTGSGGLTMTGVWDNAGYIEAAGAGILHLDNYNDTNGGGRIEATKSGASIVLNNANITDAIFTTVAGSTTSVLGSGPGINNALTDGMVNAGQIDISDSSLTIGNHIFNSGTIDLTGTTSADTLVLTGNDTRLADGGKLILGDTVGNSILSDGKAEDFRNIDNTVSGYGTIGDANVTVENELDGTIDANTAKALEILTGSNQVLNSGLIESTSTGGLTVDAALYDAGNLTSSAGDLFVDGAVTGLGNANIIGDGEIEFAAGAGLNTYFSGGGAGILKLDHSSTAGDAFDGLIHGFAGSDEIDFADIPDVIGTTSFVYTPLSNEGMLTLTSGSKSSTLYFEGNYTQQSFTIGSDNHGGTILKL